MPRRFPVHAPYYAQEPCARKYHDQSTSRRSPPRRIRRGDELWIDRCGTQRILDIFTLRKLCDIGDEFADGYIHFTIRSNAEYLFLMGAKVEPSIKAITDAGFIVGGTKNFCCDDFSHTGLVTL